MADSVPAQTADRLSTFGAGLRAASIRSRSHDRLLAAASVVCILGLAAARVWEGPGAVKILLALALVMSFVALTALNFRLAVAIALFELVLAGASGHWARFPGGLTGRIFLDAVVTIAAGVTLARSARARGWDSLGSWAAHALLLAVLFPLLWMTLGFLQGNRLADVVGDGNGLIFFAFALVVTLIIRRGEASWLRGLFFSACTANALFTAALFLVSVTHLVRLSDLHEALDNKLLVGNVIGYMPNGAYRLYLASGLYLQVGLALTTWRLLETPRRAWLWALYGILWLDLVATYTRGLWVGAVLSVVLVLVIGAPSMRRLLEFGAATAGMFVVVGVIGVLAGFSLPHYLGERASTIFATRAVASISASVDLLDSSFESGRGWSLNRGMGGSAVTASASGHARTGTRSLMLVNPSSGGDVYVFQDVRMTPGTAYKVSAWVNASGLQAPATLHRGLLVWDRQNGYVYATRLARRSGEWRNLSLLIVTGPAPGPLEIRLYAPQGTVYWDDVRMTVGRSVTPREAIPPFDAGPPPARKALASPGLETGAGWRLYKPFAGPVTAGFSSHAKLGRRSIELVNRRKQQNDDFLYQDLALVPRSLYSISAWVDVDELRSSRLPTRGLFVWDAPNGAIIEAPVTGPTKGWKRLSVVFASGSRRGVLEVRLYAPQGRIYWDALRMPSPARLGHLEGVAPPAAGFSTKSDLAGEISNRIRVEQAKVLLRHIEDRPLFGHGFGSIARDYRYGRSYSYELAYLDLAFKTGVIGLLLFLSFPARIIWSAVQARRGLYALPDGVSRRESSVVIAIVLGVLVVGGTNPSFLAAFGLCPILVSLAWLERPLTTTRPDATRTPQSGGAA